MRRKKFICVIIVMVQFLMMGACGNAVDSAKDTVIINDINGDNVTIPADIEKVICRSGNGTSFIVAMGYADKLIGTADYVVTNPWADRFAKGISKMATFGWAPSSEEIFAVGADLVMVADPEVASSLRSDGIDAVCYKQYNEEEIIASAKLMGNIFGEEATDYVNEWIAYYNEIDTYLDKALSTINDEEKPIVYYIYGQSNKGVGRTSGGGSIEQFWIENAGGIFATTDLSNDGPTITEEEVISRNPEVIFIGGIYSSLLKEELMRNPAWSNVSAVSDGSIYQIPIGFIPWDFYGVEFPLLRLWATKQIYPELIDMDMQKTTKDFYDKFYKMNFSDEEISFILNGLSPEGTEFAEE